jgi:hypothetical protein
MPDTKSNKGKGAPKKSSNRRRRRRRTNGGNQGSHLQLLSHCVESYKKVLSNPFSQIIELPCIPDTITIPSFKTVVMCRGTFTTNNPGGVGWAAFNPMEMIQNVGSFTGTTSSFPVVSTTSAFTASVYGWSVTGGVPTTGCVGTSSNSIFSPTAAVTPGFQYRLVGAGIRARFTGTQLSMGGRMLCYRQRSNAEVLGGPTAGSNSTIGTLLNDVAFRTSPVSRNWQGVAFVPDAPVWLGYVNYTAGQNGYNQLILLEGALLLPFEFEAIAYFETIGNSMPVSPSQADPVGHGRVMSAQPAVVNPSLEQQERTWTQSIFDNFAQAGSYAAHGAAYVGVPSMATVAGSLLYNNYVRPRTGRRQRNIA